MAFFWRNRAKDEKAQRDRDRDELLKTLLATEKARIDRHAEIEAARQQVELKKAELELENLERIGEEKRRDLQFKQTVRERNREQLREARARQKEKRLQREAQPHQTGCEECDALREGRQPKHASDLIRHRIENHSATLFPN